MSFISLDHHTIRTEPAAAPGPHATHVLVCGGTDAAVDIALLLRRLGEAVTLLADDLRSDARQLLVRAGVRVVPGSPSDPGTLADAGAAEARSMVIAVRSDLGCVEVALAARAAHPTLPLVCCVADADLAAQAERSLGVRSAVCLSTIEAVHLAGCALGADVAGAFSMGDDLVLLRRAPAPARKGGRVLVVEESDGRCIVAPSPSMPVSPEAVVTTVEHVPARSRGAASRLARLVRSIRGNTPPALGWTAAVLALLATASIFAFRSGMRISFSDAAYLVLNTITTVGYGDITPFGSGRLMHLAGAFVALLGPALLGTLLLIFARVVLRPQREVPPARGHVVIAARPPIAATAASRLASVGVDAVVAEARGVDTRSVDTLLRDANAATASALIAATDDPVANVTLGLAAREGNPAIHVVVGGPARLARDLAMATPSSAATTGIALAASAACVAGVRYAVAIGPRVFSFFEGPAGSEWAGRRPREVSGSHNFLTLFRRASGGRWRAAAENDAPFAEDEMVLVAAWRRLEEEACPQNP